MYNLFNLYYIYSIHNTHRISYVINNNKISELGRLKIDKSYYYLILNFKKSRFFPYMHNNFYKKVLFNSSLGIFCKNFSNKKSFLKSKSSYIMSATFIRRMLLYIQVPYLVLAVNKIPKFFRDILFTILANSNSMYTHPFSRSFVNEKFNSSLVIFSFLMFNNNKCYGPIKKKKRGRVKRKITKKLFLYNNIAD